jgi:DedD protein
MAASASEDTEITLGTGKMLTLFFALVILCAVFFGMGFSLGKNSLKPAAGELSPVPASNGVRPSAVRANGVSPATADSGPAKTISQKGDGQAAANPDPGSRAPADDGAVKPPDPGSVGPSNGYFVQVAAVSKQEDAEALVDALKKKQYPALAANLPTDKLFHVEVGPFADIKEAESMRTKLLGDGYNPILKK